MKIGISGKHHQLTDTDSFVSKCIICRHGENVKFVFALCSYFFFFQEESMEHKIGIETWVFFLCVIVFFSFIFFLTSIFVETFKLMGLGNLREKDTFRFDMVRYFL